MTRHTQVRINNVRDIEKVWRDFLKAAAKGDLRGIMHGIENEEDISDAFTMMLGVAAAHGHCEIIKCLIANGADVNASIDEDNNYIDGDTPLMVAIWNCQVEATRLLLENGADVDVKTAGGSLPLAIIDSHPYRKTNAELSIIDLLLAKGVDIESRNQCGFTLLHTAAVYGRADLLPELVSRGALVNTTDYNERTPLYSACLARSFDSVKFLVSHGVEINHLGGCLGLGMAAVQSCLDIVNLLLDHGAKPFPGSPSGLELRCAAVSNKPEIVQLMIDHGYGSQGPESLLAASLHDAIHVVAQLLDHGVRADVQNSKQQTALHIAVLGKALEQVYKQPRNDVIKLLIERGADVNAVDAEGKTALDLAREMGYFDVVEIFETYQQWVRLSHLRIS